MVNKRIEDIIKKFDIDTQFYTKPKKDKKFPKVRDVITLLPNYNYQSDVLFLPTTDDGYKYLLLVLDLATNEFDCEPMKTKNSSETTKAMKKIFNRNILRKPEVSIKTDKGSEFKGDFSEYLKDNNIFHRQLILGKKSKIHVGFTLLKKRFLFKNKLFDMLQKIKSHYLV